jgi:hypothetical protein
VNTKTGCCAHGEFCDPNSILSNNSNPCSPKPAQ